jgi:starch-binding outer membrane protein, SusD/RagB family
MAYEDAQGVSIRTKVDNSGNVLSRTYTVITAQDRDWKPRFYFFPIKLDEINRNNKLVQNPLY